MTPKYKSWICRHDSDCFDILQAFTMILSVLRPGYQSFGQPRGFDGLPNTNTEVVDMMPIHWTYNKLLFISQ